MSAVDLKIAEHIAVISFQGRDAGNTIDLTFGQEFLAATEAIVDSPDVRVVVLTGVGKNFCLGGDLKAMLASDLGTEDYLRTLTRALHGGVLNLVRAQPPVIAAVNGAAAGAGLGLTLASDLVIAAQSAQFIAAYSAVGLTPDAGCTFMLPRVVGRMRASELFLTNRRLDANTALQWGLVNAVVDDQCVLSSAKELASTLINGPTGAYGATKRLLEESLPGLAEHLERESRSIASRGITAEGREGIQSFIAKRPPSFRKR